MCSFAASGADLGTTCDCRSELALDVMSELWCRKGMNKPEYRCWFLRGKPFRYDGRLARMMQVPELDDAQQQLQKRRAQKSSALVQGPWGIRLCG